MRATSIRGRALGLSPRPLTAYRLWRRTWLGLGVRFGFGRRTISRGELAGVILTLTLTLP